eukprot:scaffold22624_cov49-Attheya_sp.AAC.1
MEHQEIDVKPAIRSFIRFSRLHLDANLEDPPIVNNTEYRRVVNITQPLNDSTLTIHTEGNYSLSMIHNAEAPRDLKDPIQINSEDPPRVNTTLSIDAW